VERSAELKFVMDCDVFLSVYLLSSAVSKK